MTSPLPDTNTAIVLGMASTALPFARSPEGEAERWLRILRLHGEAGTALQSLGVSETPLDGTAGESEERPGAAAATAAPGGESRDPVSAVTVRAGDVAGARGAQRIETRDVLTAVIHIYGEGFDALLRRHGTDSAEVLESLDAHAGAAH